MCNNGKTVLGEKRFVSYKLVFELTIGFQYSQNSINHKDNIGLLVKNEPKNICKCYICSSFLCAFLYTLFCDVLANSFIFSRTFLEEEGGWGGGEGGGEGGSQWGRLGKIPHLHLTFFIPSTRKSHFLRSVAFPHSPTSPPPPHP